MVAGFWKSTVHADSTEVQRYQSDIVAGESKANRLFGMALLSLQVSLKEFSNSSWVEMVESSRFIEVQLIRDVVCQRWGWSGVPRGRRLPPFLKAHHCRFDDTFNASTVLPSSSQAGKQLCSKMMSAPGLNTPAATSNQSEYKRTSRRFCTSINEDVN